MMAMLRSRGRACGGFTLIELMVGLVLGLMVMGAAIALYLSNSQAARFQNGVLRLQENGRFAIDILSRTTRMAGYDDPSTSFSVTTPLINGTTSSAGVLISQTGLKSDADTLSVRFEGGSSIRDCQGQSVSASSWVLNQYAITTDNNLVCATVSDSGTTRNNALLAEGIEDMRVLYGIDLNNDLLANHYVDADSVNNWSQVVSIQIAILASSVDNVLPVADTICLGCSAFTGTSDYQLRAEFQTTIGIRN